MGTIAIYKNIRIVIHTRDHTPPHVHAIAPDAEAVFNLLTIELIRSKGFDYQSVMQIKKFIELRNEELLEAWDEIHEKKIK